MKAPSKSAANPVRRKPASEPFFHDNPLPMWVYDARALCFLDDPAAALEASGYSREEFLTSRVPDIIRVGDDAKRRTVSTKLKNQRPAAKRIHLHHKRGSDLLFDCVSAPTLYQGHPAEFVTAIAVPEAPTPGEAFSALVDGAADCIVLANPQGRIMLVNQQLEQRFGYARGELLGESLELLLPQRFQDKHRERLATFLSDPSPRVLGTGMVLRARRKDGSEFPVEISLSPVQLDQGPCIMAAIRDVTERREINAALSYASTIVGASPVGILTWNANGQFISANEAATRILGATVEEMQQLNFRELDSWKQTGLLPAAEAALRTHENQRVEAHGVSAFGQEVWIDVYFIPFSYEEETHLLTLVSDILKQKRAELELRRTEALYRDLVDNTRALMCTHDLQGKLLSVNPWATRLLGYEATELIGHSIEEFLAPATRRGFRAYMRQLRQHGSADGVMQVMTASGQKRLWEFHNTVRTEDVPEPIVRGTAFDITEQRESQEALRSSEASYKLLFEAAPVGIALTDTSGHLLEFNDAILEPGGYSRADARQINNLADLYVDPAERETALALFREQGYLSKYPARFKRKDGSAYDALLSLRKLEINGRVRVQALVEDITQQRAAEDALRKSEALYRELFNNALEGIFRTTPDGRFVSANPALVRMLGCENENDLLALNVRDLYVDPQLRVHNLERIVETGELRDFEIHLQRRDGGVLIALENSRAIRDASGQVILYEGTLTDITERQHIEEALRASEAELRALFEAIPDLVLVMDKDGRYLKVVPGHDDMLYAPASELLKKSMTDVFSQPKAEEFLGYIHQALLTHQPVHFEYALLIGADIRWFSAAIAPLTDASVVWVARDITRQKEAEEQVQRRLAELEALYESGLSLGKTLDPREISRRVIEVLTDRLHWHHAAVRVRRADSEEVELLAFSESPGQDHPSEEGQRLARNAITQIGQGMAGWAMRYGRMINSGNLPEDPRYHATFPDMRSGLYVPIWAAGRVLGCISVETQQREAFNDADERLLSTLASQAAAAFENARLFAETQQRVSESLTLYEFTRDLTAQSDLSALLKTLAERVASLLNVPGGGVYLYDAARQQLEIVTGTDATLPIGSKLQLGQGMAGTVAQTREPMVVDDYRAWEGRPGLYQDRPWAAVLEVPMLYRGELIGVLAAYVTHSADSSASGERKRFSEDDIRLLSLFAASAAGAIYSARLFDAERLRREEAEELRQQAVQAAERLSTLHAATREIAHISQDPEEVYASIHQAASRLLPMDAFTIALVDEKRNKIHGAYLFDRDGRSPSMDIPVGESFTSRVIQAGETLRLDDVEAINLERVHFGSPEHVRSILAVPLRAGGKIIGTLSAQSYAPNVYQPGDQVLLEMLAAQAAIAIQNARLYQHALRSAERQAVLHQVSQSLTRISQDPEQLYAAIHAAAARLMPADLFTIVLADEDRKHAKAVYSVEAGERWPVTEFATRDSYTGWVLEQERTLFLDDAHESGIVKYTPFPNAADTRSVLMVPLGLGDQAIGVMSVQSYEPDQYSEEDQTILELLGSQAAVAIQNASLFDETSRRAEEFKALYESAYTLPLQQDTGSLLSLVLERATELLHVSEGTLYLYDAQHQLLMPALRRGTQLESEEGLQLGEGAAGRVALSRQPLILDDYQAWDGRASQFDGVPYRAVLEVPMLYGGELIGVLGIHEIGPNAARKFNGREARLLSLFASQAAAAIYNARLLEDTRRRLHELESLAMVGDALTGTLELEPLLENILRTARQAIPSAEKGTIVLREPGEHGHLHVRAQVGYGDLRMMDLPFADNTGYAGRAFHDKRAIIVRDAVAESAEYEIPFDQEFEEVNKIRSAIVAPLVVKDEAIGAIALDNLSRTSAFDESDLRLLGLFASSAAVVIENARLFEETRQRAREFEVLYDATRDLSAAPQDLSSLLSMLVEKAARLMGSHGSGMYLYDRARGDLEMAVVSSGEQGAGARIALGEGAAGRVAEARIPMVIEDYQGWEGRRPLLDGIPYRALLIVPMVYGGELIGVLDAYEYGSSDRKFSEADVKLLSLFASQAAGAVHSARLFEETRKKAAQFASLYETARDLSDQRNVDQLLQTIVERASKLLHAPVSGIYLHDKARNDLYVAVNLGFQSSMGVRLALGEGVAGRVAQTRQPILIEDYQKWEGRSSKYEDVPLRSILEVPMLYSGELIGVLTVDELGDSERKFTQEDADLLSLFASYAASIVHTARLFEQISRRATEFEVLYKTAADLSSQTNVQTLLDTVIERARDLMDAVGAVVYLHDPHTGELEVMACHDPDIRKGLHMSPGEGMSGRVALSKQSLIVTDYQNWEGRSAQYEGLPYSSAVAVPMIYSGQLIGVLNVYNRADRDSDKARPAFRAEDAHILELLANSAAGAVYVARLLEQTRRRLEQLSALHAVDTAIGSTTDLRVSLQAVLDGVLRQLGVDAADVLLLNPSTLTLQYSAGSGFFTSEINRTATSIGAGRAGKAALERQIVHIPDLAAEHGDLSHANLIAAERFKAYVGVPLIAKGEVKGVLEVFQRTPIDFDDERRSLLEVLAGQAALAIDNAQLFEGLEKANLELTMAYDATIEGWSQALELRDQETQGHSNRVVELTLRMAAALGLPDRQLRDIRRGVLLHDIGKMGIPDAILHKPGPLTEEEWQIMRQHPQYAYNMLAPIVYLRNSLEIPYAHHEKWDGTGYPRGLKAETIPLAARIFCVVDVYDALTSNRPYRGAWSEEKTLEYIEQQAGRHFDPQIVQVFLRLIRG
ncbi:MAG: GAF domain-containing protein [Anaerolineae bacterium]